MGVICVGIDRVVVVMIMVMPVVVIVMMVVVMVIVAGLKAAHAGAECITQRTIRDV